MTYKEIKERVLQITGKGCTPVITHFGKFARDGLADIVCYIPICMRERYILRESVIDICDLKRLCFDIVDVIDKDGNSVPFDVQTASQYIDVPWHVRYCTVCYRYVPHKFKDYLHKPDIPDVLHKLLVLYIVAQAKRFCNDQDADAAYALYEKERNRIANEYRGRFLEYVDE